jgi:hypothetical protein
MTRARPGVLIVGLTFVACGSSTPPPEEPNSAVRPSGVYLQPDSTATATSSNDAPEISRSAGVAGGIVVLWPRIVLPRGAEGPDAETRQVAGSIQRRLAELAKSAAGGRPIEVRPEPERVCPKQGCNAVAVGALLARAGGGCAVVAWTSAPGPSPAELVSWAGQIQLKATTVPFREAAEKFMSVADYAPCGTVLTEPPARDSDVTAAIQRAASAAR